MADSLILYHNPHCSKSRQTKQIIDEKGVSTEVVEYLKAPPDAEELDRILTLLGLEPRQLMRRQEAPYQALGLDDPALDRDALIRAMVANPILIERPIAIRGNRAVIGRPPEKVLELL
jgi:arsenate reductase